MIYRFWLTREERERLDEERAARERRKRIRSLNRAINALLCNAGNDTSLWCKWNNSMFDHASEDFEALKKYIDSAPDDRVKTFFEILDDIY